MVGMCRLSVVGRREMDGERVGCVMEMKGKKRERKKRKDEKNGEAFYLRRRNGRETDTEREEGREGGRACLFVRPFPLCLSFFSLSFHHIVMDYFALLFLSLSFSLSLFFLLFSIFLFFRAHSLSLSLSLSPSLSLSLSFSISLARFAPYFFFSLVDT